MCFNSRQIANPQIFGHILLWKSTNVVGMPVRKSQRAKSAMFYIVPVMQSLVEHVEPIVLQKEHVIFVCHV
jgi:hypothetical protein